MTKSDVATTHGFRRFIDVALDPVGEALMSLFMCVGLEPGAAAYVSTPLTSGELILEWQERRLRGESLQQPPKEAIYQENSARAAKLIASVRAEVGGHVIEPTSLVDLPGWDQVDYHAFWCATIQKFAHSVYFNRGWQYSTGCAAEFAAAVLSGSALYDDQLRPMSATIGVRLLKEARGRLSRVGLQTELLDDALTALAGVD